jgi:RNA recognition motif-containing protein
MQTKLFVRNLSFNTTEDELQDLFAAHGEVKSARIATDRDTGKARGFAFVEMNSQGEAEAAISALDSREFGGRQLFVVFSEPKESRASTSYGYRN